MPIIGIVENSGAIITDWNGNKKFSDGNVLVSTNLKIHKYFLKLMKN